MIFKNDRTFQSQMEEIDAELRSEDMPITGRPIAAISKISKRFKCSIRFDGVEAKRINKWFEDRYGDRLKVDWSIGKTIILIKDDPYLVKYPLIFGQFQVNPFDWVHNLTPSTIKSLKNHELEQIASEIMQKFGYFALLRLFQNECLADLPIAVEQIISNHPQYGLSQWASLQAVEKTLKFYISSNNIKPPRSHDLRLLADMASDIGLNELNDDCLTIIQCSPGVRYNEPKVSLIEAKNAHDKCLKLCSEIAAQIECTA